MPVMKRIVFTNYTDCFHKHHILILTKKLLLYNFSHLLYRILREGVLQMIQKRVNKIKLSHYFWVFLIVSLGGTIYEELLHIVLYFFKTGTFNWSRRSGLFYTPLSPVYGFGAVGLLFLLGRKDYSKTKIYIGASLLGGIAEYCMSIIQEWVTGTTSWDYSNKFLNIGGRTTVIYMLAWGLAGLVLIKWFYPKIRQTLNRMSACTYKIVTSILFTLVLLDISVSWTALIRRELRHRGIEPYTIVGHLCDKYYTDEFVESRYPNMEEKEE